MHTAMSLQCHCNVTALKNQGPIDQRHKCAGKSPQILPQTKDVFLFDPSPVALRFDSFHILPLDSISGSLKASGSHGLKPNK
jgi:hypothetical protein